MKIGFTVGVWDVFHRGHKIFLERARQYCDYLIIGVMTDYWIRVQKGHDRPKESLVKRIQNVRPYGDKVISLDTMDMSQYLQVADIWIKGEDQKNMRPEEYPNIVLLNRTPNISTTQLLKKEK